MANTLFLIEPDALQQAKDYAAAACRETGLFSQRFDQALSELDEAVRGIDEARAEGWSTGVYNTENNLNKTKKSLKEQTEKALTISLMIQAAIDQGEETSNVLTNEMGQLQFTMQGLANIANNFNPQVDARNSGQVLGATKSVALTGAALTGAFALVQPELFANLQSALEKFTKYWTHAVETIVEKVSEYMPVSFEPRTMPPTKDNPYYGDLATTANCTTYAENRAHEILENTEIDFKGDAKTWWKYKNDFQGYSENVNEPKIGALMVWGDENCTGPGHVAIVEDIIYNADGTVNKVIYSESAWGGLWYNGKEQQYCGQYNWYGNATSYWGCTGQTPSQIEKVTQTVNKKQITMGFVGYIYLI